MCFRTDILLYSSSTNAHLPILPITILTFDADVLFLGALQYFFDAFQLLPSVGGLIADDGLEGLLLLL